MVKRWIVMIVLALMLALGCIFESIFVHNSFNWLINSLESLQIELTEHKDKIDTDKFVIMSNQIHDEWHEKVIPLKCLIWHSGIKDVETGLARISVYIKENDYTEAYAEIATLIDSTAHYLDDFSVSVENIC